MRCMRPGDMSRVSRLLVAAAKPFRRFQCAAQIGLYGIVGRAFAGKQKGLDSCLFEVLCRPPAHSVAQNRLAIAKRLDNRSVAVMVLTGMVWLALPQSVGCELIISEHHADDLIVFDLVHEEAARSTEMV